VDASRPSNESIEEVVAAGVLLDLSRVVSDLLTLARPALGARTELITGLVRLIVRELDVAFPWEFEVAARLSQIGLLAVADQRHRAAGRGEPLSDEEWLELVSHPLAARDLLAGVGRLDGVRGMIERQREPFALRCEPPAPILFRSRIVLGGHVLRVCADYVALLERDLAPSEALASLSSQPLECDPVLVVILARCVAADDESHRAA
jgi:hypothetical protein